MKLYNTLLDSLSHELLTPISTIMVQLRLQNATNPSEENKTKLLSEIDKASLRLNYLKYVSLGIWLYRAQLDLCDVKELVYNVLSNRNETLWRNRITVKSNEYLLLFKLDNEHTLRLSEWSRSKGI